MRSPLESAIARAFKAAQQSRSEKGLDPAEMKIRRRRDGTRWVGPESYRITLYLRPWQYLALIERKAAAHFPGSLTKFIQSSLEKPGGTLLYARRRAAR